MTRKLVLALLVGSAMAAVAGVDGAQNQDDKVDAAAAMGKLEGNWKLVRSEFNGNLGAGLERAKIGLFIEDGKIFWTQDGLDRGGQKGDLTIDPSTSPKSIEVEITRGGNIGKKMLGIFEIKGNKLTICWGEPGDEKRPKKFITKKAVGAGVRLETYESLEEEKSAVKEENTNSKKGDGPVDAAAETKRLEGNWKLTRKEYKGNLWPGVDRGRDGIFIEDGKIFWTHDGSEAGQQKGELTIDPSTSPKSIEVEVTRGGSIGKKLLGIYEIKGNKLTICWSEPGGAKRPTKFVTKMAVGAGAMLETYQSQEEDEKAPVKANAPRGNAARSRKSDAQADTAAETKILEGNWKLTRMEHKGNLRPGADGGKAGIFIEDGKIFWTHDGREAGGQKGELTIDPTTNPKSIEVEITRGSLIGKKMLGIYELKGKKLTICWGEPGGEKRPTKFVTKTARGAGTFLENYQKLDD